MYLDSTLNSSSIDAAQSVVVTVQASATFSPDSGTWTYTYTVANDITSQNNVEHFAIAPIARLIRVDAPAHWDHQFYSYQGSDSGVVWATVDVGHLPPGYIDTGNLPPSEYAIPPGGSLTFSFTTRAPPLPTGEELAWYAQGFDTLQDEADEIEDITPPTVFTDAVTGTAIGPDKASLVGVVEGAPGSLRLERPRPNPARSGVSVEFEVPSSAAVRLAVYDVAGRRARLLVDKMMPAGIHSVTWNGRNDLGSPCHPGVYFLRMFVDGKATGNRRVTILK